MVRKTGLALTTATAMLAFTSSARAQSTGLEDMVGARAGQAESALQARGYRMIRGEKGDDRSYTYWWSDARRQCVTIATMDGCYASITPTLPPDCRQGPASRPRPGSDYDPGSASFLQIGTRRAPAILRHRGTRLSAVHRSSAGARLTLD